MRILVCAATVSEIEPTASWLKISQLQGIEIMITGVGMSAATYEITKAIYSRKPDFIIQAGITGALGNKFPAASVVVVENECIGDLGVHEQGQFRSLIDMGFTGPDTLPYSDGKLKNDSITLSSFELPIANAVTVNEITTNPERITHYQKKYDASIESMEGAALHYVCLREGIPFLQLRSISNRAGERNKEQWHIKSAITSLNIELIRIIKKLILS